jgi:hypothetical protein
MLPDDLVLLVWGAGWTHGAATAQLRTRFRLLDRRWWPYWNLLARSGLALALWGSPRHAVAKLPPLTLLRVRAPLPFPELPPPPLFTHVVQGDMLACVVRDCLWVGAVRRILQNTTPHIGRWRRLRCGDFTVVQMDGDIFWSRGRAFHRTSAWTVLV